MNEDFVQSRDIQIKVVIEPVGDGNRDGNRGELWRTLADERTKTHIQGERWRTVANAGERKNAGLKTTKVQAFGGSNPSPSASALFWRRLWR